MELGRVLHQPGCRGHRGFERPSTSGSGSRSLEAIPAEGWQILRNGDHTIGLFQGMFDKNILTFNPGWDSQARPLDDVSRTCVSCSVS